jgi:hypothetical protein
MTVNSREPVNSGYPSNAIAFKKDFNNGAKKGVMILSALIAIAALGCSFAGIDSNALSAMRHFSHLPTLSIYIGAPVAAVVASIISGIAFLFSRDRNAAVQIPQQKTGQAVPSVTQPKQRVSKASTSEAEAPGHIKAEDSDHIFTAACHSKKPKDELILEATIKYIQDCFFHSVTTDREEVGEIKAYSVSMVNSKYDAKKMKYTFSMTLESMPVRIEKNKDPLVLSSNSTTISKIVEVYVSPDSNSESCVLTLRFLPTSG